MNPLIRPGIEPGMQNYRVESPLATHWRKASCEEADCAAQAYGWQTRIDLKAELGQKQAHYIRALSGRKFTEQVDPDSDTVLFLFDADQTCFAQHQIPLERPELYVVDSAFGRRIHSSGDAWVDDLCTNQQNLADFQRAHG
jgi:hypothetical protein